MAGDGTSGPGQIRFGLLHSWILCGFVFAQPMFDLLSRNAAFFVAHHADRIDVVVWVIIACIALPGTLTGLELVARYLSPRIGRQAHLVIVATLLSLLGLLLLNHFGYRGWPAGVSLVLAMASGIVCTMGYASFPMVRVFVTALAPAILVFPALFLFGDGMAPIMAPHSGTGPVREGAADDSERSRTPVVLVIFDELPVTSLLNERYEIDGVRYPNFAVLAQGSTWFRYAVTDSGSTIVSVPMILSGTGPEPKALPVYREYPQNLFTILRDSHTMNVIESHTMLCPDDICTAAAIPGVRINRFRAMGSDLAVVFLHLLLPGSLADTLPPITRNWKQFGVAAAQSPPAMEEIADRAAHFYSDRIAVFDRFVNSIAESDEPGLHVVHSLLPHVPWEYFPSGVAYARRGATIPGLAPGTERWIDNQGLVDQGYQRHLLQVGLTDHLLGRLLERLRTTGLYDASFIVVTSDHGARFWPGATRRGSRGRHRQDIRRIPLFVKFPHQRDAVVTDWPAGLVDLVPTIADWLGTGNDVGFDGSSIFRNRVVCDRGAMIPLNNHVLEGHVDRIEERPGQLVLAGWAADTSRFQPASRILIFAGNTFVGAFPLERNRPDIARMFGDSALLRSGFEIKIPTGASGNRSQVRIMAVTKAGVASELTRPDAEPATNAVEIPGPLSEKRDDCLRAQTSEATFLATIAGSDGFWSDRAWKHPAAEVFRPVEASLSRKLELLEGNSLQDVFLRTGPFRQWLGQPVDTRRFPIVHGERAIPDLAEEDLDVGADAMFVPALITGTLVTDSASGTGGKDRPDALVAVVNGTIRDIVTPYPDETNTMRFSFFVPESSFVAGNNTFTLLRIRSDGTETTFSRIPLDWHGS